MFDFHIVTARDYFKMSPSLNNDEGDAKDNWKKMDYILPLNFATWSAQLVERQSAVWEVEGSSPRPDHHSES